MGELSIDFRFPESAFLYRATSPRLRIDRAEQPVPGWGTHRFAVQPGEHRVGVWVPYAMPRRAGKAERTVTVAEGGSLSLEYLAPTVTFARGSLGEPGQQRSAGHSAVKTANIVALVAIVAFFVVVLLFR